MTDRLRERSEQAPKVIPAIRGNLRWKLEGLTVEEGLARSRIAIAEQFYQTFPDFQAKFPANSEGKIDEDRREEAEEFVIGRIGSRKKFAQVFGLTPLNKNKSPWFRGSYAVAMHESFGELGLGFGDFFRQADQTGIYKDVEGNEWAAVDYFRHHFGMVANIIRSRVDSLNTLRALNTSGKLANFYSLAEVRELKTQIYDLPQVDKKSGWYIDDEGKRWATAAKIHASLPVGYNTIVEVVKSLQTQLGRDQNGAPRNLVCEDEVLAGLRRMGYFKDESQISVKAAGEDGALKQIEALPLEQGVSLFSDYLEGKISFNDLLPFILDTFHFNQQMNIYGAYLGSGYRYNVKVVDISRGLSKSIEKNPQLLAVPKQDDLGLYRWFEFYPVGSGGEVDIKFPPDSFRINNEEKRLEKRYWYGPNKQMFLEYVLGKLDIAPELLREFSVKVSGYSVINIGTVDRESVFFGDKSLAEYDGRTLTVKPYVDSEHGFTWIEIFQSEEGSSILKKRFYKGEKKFTEWRGVKEEAFLDWIDGKLPIEKVDEFVIDFGQTGVIRLVDTKQSSVKISVTNNYEERFPTGRAIVRPKQNELYEWVELYAVNPDSSVADLPSASLRVERQKKAKLNGKWTGPSKQPYVDFLEGQLSYDQLPSLILKLPPTGRLNLFSFRGKTLTMHMKDLAEFSGEEFKIIPVVGKDGSFCLEVLSPGDELLKKYSFDKEAFSLELLPEYRKYMPAGYWTPDRIEQTVLDFIKENGSFSHNLLVTKKRFDIIHAINTQYPGGINRLRESIGYVDSAGIISTLEANKALDSLFEV